MQSLTEKPGNKATFVERIKAAKKLKVELLYSVSGRQAEKL